MCFGEEAHSGEVSLSLCHHVRHTPTGMRACVPPLKIIGETWSSTVRCCVVSIAPLITLYFAPFLGVY